MMTCRHLRAREWHYIEIWSLIVASFSCLNLSSSCLMIKTCKNGWTLYAFTIFYSFDGLVMLWHHITLWMLYMLCYLMPLNLYASIEMWCNCDENVLIVTRDILQEWCGAKLSFFVDPTPVMPWSSEIFSEVQFVGATYRLVGDIVIDNAIVGNAETDSVMKWHRQLGYRSEHGRKVLQKQDLLSGLKYPSLGFCEDC